VPNSFPFTEESAYSVKYQHFARNNNNAIVTPTLLTKSVCSLLCRKLNVNVNKKLLKSYIWSMALYGTEIWTLRNVDQKYLESSNIWYWRRVKMISGTDHTRNEEVSDTVKEDRIITHTENVRKSNWSGHILRSNYFPKPLLKER
jgi:hypothetical protein